METEQTSVENKKLEGGMKIEIVKNSIRFYAPDGRVFYKNFTNFMKVALKPRGNRAIFTHAPEDMAKITQQPKLEQPLMVVSAERQDKLVSYVEIGGDAQ